MLSFFKSQQPITVLGIFVFFLIVKIPFFCILTLPIIQPLQNYWISTGILLSGSLFFNVVLAQICLLIQAFWFNYLFHKADYNEKRTMIPALYFIMISTVLPVFNVLSIYTLIGFLLLIIFHTLLQINTKDSALLQCFNLGALGGFLLLINIHFIIFIPFLFIILYILKPFNFEEYMMLFFGLVLPVYFAFSISYINDISINWEHYSFRNFYLIQFNKNAFSIITLGLTALYLLFSFISLNGIMYSTGFKRRKNLYLLIFYFIGIFLTVLFSGNLDKAVLTILFIPVAIFLSLLMLRIRKKRIAELLNAIFVLVTFVTNIVMVFK